MKKVVCIINEVLKNKSKKELKEIKDSDHLRNDLGFDSFDLAELTVLIEDEFDIDIFEDGVVNTFGEIISKLKIEDETVYSR